MMYKLSNGVKPAKFYSVNEKFITDFFVHILDYDKSVQSFFLNKANFILHKNELFSLHENLKNILIEIGGSQILKLSQIEINELANRSRGLEKDEFIHSAKIRIGLRLLKYIEEAISNGTYIEFSISDI